MSRPEFKVQTEQQLLASKGGKREKEKVFFHSFSFPDAIFLLPIIPHPPVQSRSFSIPRGAYTRCFCLPPVSHGHLWATSSSFERGAKNVHHRRQKKKKGNGKKKKLFFFFSLWPNMNDMAKV